MRDWDTLFLTELNGCVLAERSSARVPNRQAKGIAQYERVVPESQKLAEQKRRSLQAILRPIRVGTQDDWGDILQREHIDSPQGLRLTIRSEN